MSEYNAQYIFWGRLWDPPVKRVAGALSVGVKRLGREADRSPPCSAELNNACSYPPFPNTPSWRGAQLKHSYLPCLLHAQPTEIFFT